ncbi:hypothetical protein [Endozoicomonas lisbonensis]|uniref:Uncharacterized protein n=1 Tax=Endozoicomonas lisbonensis TaxID=3120522 RepID=A0ABV2SH71_9GAMM
MPDARIGSTQISPISRDNAPDKTQAPDATGKLGRFKVAKLKLSEGGFLNRISNLFSKKTPSTPLGNRKITKTPVEPKLMQPGSKNKKTARAAANPVKQNSSARNKADTTLHALKNQPGVSDSFKTLDKVLMTVVKTKADMQAHPRNSRERREASLELQLAQKELKQAVNEFNSKSSAAGLEPLNTYDLELAMLNGHIEGFDGDKANLEKYQSIKKALS